MNERERLFVEYWERRRDREGEISFQLLSGLPFGFLFSTPILLVLLSGRWWYKRADMVANAQMSPWILAIAVFFIAFFVAVFYKRHQWEMKEQQYREILARREKQVTPSESNDI
jgi:hypothetical protein